MVRALIAVVLLSGCASATPTAPLRVMTYNIRLNLASDGANAWPHRKDAVAALVLAHNTDLLGVQEALPDQLSDLDTRLSGFARFGTGRNAERTGEHTAVFYRSARFDLLEHDTFWLSETPAVAGSKGWDAAYERIATWGRMRDRRSGMVFYVVNTHFDHVGVVARRESAKLLVAEVDRIARHEPVILIGDFNDVPGSEFYQTVTRGGFQDSISISRSVARGGDSTWNAFRAIEPGRRIDFIFVRGQIEVLAHETIGTKLADGRFPSDHLPVIASVILSEAGEGPVQDSRSAKWYGSFAVFAARDDTSLRDLELPFQSAEPHAEGAWFELPPAVGPEPQVVARERELHSL